jgi:hypothetical protein
MKRPWSKRSARRCALLVSVAFMGLLPQGCVRGRPAVGDLPQFPAEVNGWRPTAQMPTYGRENLFDYMDGAGEIYLAYDFQRILVQEYGRAGSPGITAEVYEMSTSQDAYGVFSHDPEGEDVGVGQGNAYAVGLLRFWKGRVFFRILAHQDTPDAKAAVVALARSLAEPIAEGPRPALLHRLPKDGLEPASVRYFHTQVSLNALYYLADADVLRLSPRTEAALGVYRPGGEKMTLVIVHYPDPRQAKDAYHEFDRVYLENEATADPPLRIEAVEDGRHVGALVKGSFLALVFDARSRTACQGLLAEAARLL